MPRYTVINLVDKTLSDDVDAASPGEAIDKYIADLDPESFSNDEWEALRDNLLVEPHQ